MAFLEMLNLHRLHRSPDGSYGHQAVRVQHHTVKGAPVTYVLYRCGCGDVHSEELDGAWSLMDVRGRVL